MYTFFPGAAASGATVATATTTMDMHEVGGRRSDGATTLQKQNLQVAMMVIYYYKRVLKKFKKI